MVLERRRSGVVAMASVGQKVYAPGVSVSEGNGGLQKIDLKSPHGRYFFFHLILFFRESHQAINLRVYSVCD